MFNTVKESGTPVMMMIQFGENCVNPCGSVFTILVKLLPMSVKKYCTSCEGCTVVENSDVCIENCELLKSITYYF
jgi:hypothetical protein